MMTADLPDKLYYTIREVAAHLGVEPHVLRYWESEFPLLRPKRTRSGSRAYRRRDIDLLRQIRTLLYEQGYRIEGARKVLRQRRRRAPATVAQPRLPFNDLTRPQQLQQLRQEVRAILALVREMSPAGDGTTTGDDKGGD